MTEHQRADDYSIIVLNQKFEDFVGRYERNQKEAELWRDRIEKRLEPLENIKTPFHMISVIIFLFMSGVLFEVGRWLVADVKFIGK